MCCDSHLTDSFQGKLMNYPFFIPQLYLYGKNTQSVSYSDFVNRELVLFSNMDVNRSIPCLMDGFKPGTFCSWMLLTTSFVNTCCLMENKKTYLPNVYLS